jgi:antitoxin (DNA-binding transcriptional repressor) of toxin-antitoxin stability system
MRVVGLKVLKNRLSEYVRIAAGGERVLVTDRDRVVAELIPPQVGTAEFAADAALAGAVRSGWLRPPVLPPGAVPPRLPVAPLAEVLKGLDADREDR